MTSQKKLSRKTKKLPDFVVRAERAMRRVARQLKRESATMGTPLVFGSDGKVQYVYFAFDKKNPRKIVERRRVTLKTFRRGKRKSCK